MLGTRRGHASDPESGRLCACARICCLTVKHLVGLFVVKYLATAFDSQTLNGTVRSSNAWRCCLTVKHLVGLFVVKYLAMAFDSQTLNGTARLLNAWRYCLTVKQAIHVHRWGLPGVVSNPGEMESRG